MESELPGPCPQPDRPHTQRRKGPAGQVPSWSSLQVPTGPAGVWNQHTNPPWPRLDLKGRGPAGGAPADEHPRGCPWGQMLAFGVRVGGPSLHAEVAPGGGEPQAPPDAPPSSCPPAWVCTTWSRPPRSPPPSSAPGSRFKRRLTDGVRVGVSLGVAAKRSGSPPPFQRPQHHSGSGWTPERGGCSLGNRVGTALGPRDSAPPRPPPHVVTGGREAGEKRWGDPGRGDG